MDTQNKPCRRLPLVADLLLTGVLVLFAYVAVATALGAVDWGLAFALTVVAVGGRWVSRYLP